MEMPAAPSGMVWVLRLDPWHDDAMLWLDECGTPIKCAELLAPGGSTDARLSVDKASIEEIVEAVVVAARVLARVMSGEPAGELSRRLGIKVEVKR